MTETTIYQNYDLEAIGRRIFKDATVTVNVNEHYVAWNIIIQKNIYAKKIIEIGVQWLEATACVPLYIETGKPIYIKVYENEENEYSDY